MNSLILSLACLAVAVCVITADYIGEPLGIGGVDLGRVGLGVGRLGYGGLNGVGLGRLGYRGINGVGIGGVGVGGLGYGGYNGVGIGGVGVIGGIAGVGYPNYNRYPYMARHNYNIGGVPLSSHLPIRHHHQVVPHVDETGLHNDVITKEVPHHGPIVSPLVDDHLHKK